LKKQIILNNISFWVFGILAFFFSLHIFSYYTGGDQKYYIDFYNAISGVEFNEVKKLAYQNIGAYEKLSLFVLWFGSSVLNLDKVIWVSLLNGIFIALYYRFLNKNYTSTFVIVLLMTNFYILVMLFSAERLKLAFLVIFLALNTSGIRKNILFFLSPLFHFQAFLFFPVVFIYKFSDQIKNFFIHLKISKSMLIYFLLLLAILFLFITNIAGFMHKFDSYFYREKNYIPLLITFLKISLLAFIAMKESKYKFQAGVSFVPWFVFGFMFGGQRIVIMTFAWFVYLLVIEQKLQRPLPMIILIYFSIKSISFILNIYKFGTGFPY
jgi:hypothetical protein